MIISRLGSMFGVSFNALTLFVGFRKGVAVKPAPLVPKGSLPEKTGGKPMRNTLRVSAHYSYVHRPSTGPVDGPC